MPNNLKALRDRIDTLDDQIIELLEKRFEVVQSMRKKTLTDPKREQFILQKTYSPHVQAVYQSIFFESKKIIKKNHKKKT
jgi:chorismate mutase